MRWILRWASMSVLATLASAAEGAQRISIAPVHGPAKPALTLQLRAALCAAFPCVAWSRVSTAGAPDPTKARRAGVAGTLVGVTGRVAGRRVLSLSLFTDARFASVTWRLPLDRRGTVADDELVMVIGDLAARLGGAPPAPPDAPGSARAGEKAPPPRIEPVPPPEPPEPHPPERTEAVAPPPPPPPPPPAPPPPPPAPRETRSSAPAPARRVALEIGVLGGRRELRFEGAVPAPAPLRGHVVPSFAGPVARLELYPAAPHGGVLSGLGLFGCYASSVGLETRLEGASRSTRLWRLSAGAAWRSAPLGVRRANAALSVSYEVRSATVRPAIAGLPDTDLEGLRAGVRLELPIARSLSLHGAAGYVRWLTARDLVDGRTPFFPGGAAWGVDLDAGLILIISRVVSLRLAAEYSATRYELEPDPDAIYTADASQDGQVAGTLAVRLIR